LCMCRMLAISLLLHTSFFEIFTFRCSCGIISKENEVTICCLIKAYKIV